MVKSLKGNNMLNNLLKRLRLRREIKRGLDDVKNNRVTDGPTVLERLRKRALNLHKTKE